MHRRLRMGPFAWQSPLVHILVPIAHGLMCLTTLSSLHIPASLSERKPARLAAACYRDAASANSTHALRVTTLTTQHSASLARVSATPSPRVPCPCASLTCSHCCCCRERRWRSQPRRCSYQGRDAPCSSLDPFTRAAPRGEEKVHLYLRVLLQRTAGAHACWPSFSIHGAPPHPLSPRACQAGPLLPLVLRPRAAATGCCHGRNPDR